MGAKRKYGVRFVNWFYRPGTPTLTYSRYTRDGERKRRSISRNIDVNNAAEVRQLIEDLLVIAQAFCAEHGLTPRTKPVTDEEVATYVGKWGPGDWKREQMDFYSDGDYDDEDDMPDRVRREPVTLERWQPHEATVQARYDVARVLERYGVAR